MAKSFKDLTEREILVLAIQLEEEDSRIYGDSADGLREPIQPRPKCSSTCRRKSLAIGNGSSKCTGSDSAITFR